LQQQFNERRGRRTGHVALVGAGPGDPELLTVKALKAIERADVVLFDNLVSAEVMALVPPATKCISVGKKGYGASCRQDEINGLMVALAGSGWRVVRLKAGDPLIFARAEEEMAALAEAGIAFDIVPGVSAVQGAAARLKVPLTRRDDGRRFQIITGHASSGGLPDDFDWAGLADRNAMTAVYMPKGTIGTLTHELIARGLPADHPATAVLDATRASEVIVSATLASLPARLAALSSNAPCVVLVGAALGRNALASEPRKVRHVPDQDQCNACGSGI
jgi:uroporphyrin-III C-methyltransferase / precorrin-2 dehydrogenase / sirohydrochlorin ferrochelatase